VGPAAAACVRGRGQLMKPARQPYVAGSFYPAQAHDLAATVDGLLNAAASPYAGSTRPAALVVPHAGYGCSGLVAALAYHQLMRSPRVETVVILGPGHFRDPHGLAVPECSAWRTPLGDVPVDQNLCARLVDLGLAHRDDAAHAGEHSIEVQLPFLQRVLGDGWSCVPVVARSMSADRVADCIDALTGDGVLVVASSDLSHYHDQPTAQRLDRRTAQAIVELNVAAIDDGDACGAVVVRGVLAWTQRHELSVELLDLRTSADTCSDPERVVGYGAFAAR
jgi:AmmeMemoRadiSam system protein B